jgi:hypothetical protein
VPTPVCVPPTLDVDRSLVVHDPALLAPKFGLKRTLDQIIQTSGNPGSTTAQALLQTMLDSFNATSFVHPVSGKTIPVTPRPAEATLSAADLLNPASAVGMIPVGLFNRFDLAPADGSNCGEYRIVYARRNPPLPLKRFLIIFEAKLPNPNPPSGLAGCQPIVKFWADLTAEPSDAQRIASLETFYYTGVSGFGAVVTHANYGLPLGQVRVNMFMQLPWVLREHRTALVGGIPVFKADTIKRNPLVEWFDVPANLPPGITPADQQAFRSHFLNKPVCDLMLPDRANATPTDAQIINGIGADFDPAGDDFESISQGTVDEPASHLDPAFATDVTTRIGALGVSTVTTANLMNRAGAMTCGGCHEFSNTKDLTSAVKWPPSKTFVHIDEGGGLSLALTSFFIPRRREIVSRFVCDPTPEQVPVVQCPAADAEPPAAAADAIPQPAPLNISTANLDAGTVEQLREGRRQPSLVQVDNARLAVLAAAKRLQAPQDEGTASAQSEMDRATAALDALVLRARREEQKLPGAFVPVRRTH